MNVSTPPDTAHDGRASRSKAIWLLVAGLLALRIALLGGVRYFTYPDYPSWVQPVFEIGTYLLTALLVWHERDHLSDHHIDTAALVVLILGKPLELLMRALSIPAAWPESSRPYLLWLPISIGLLVALVLARPRLKSMRARDWLWLLAGSVIGIAFGALTGYGIRLQNPYRATHRLTAALVAFGPLQQMLHAGMAEEPLFRGFLWGALRRARWKEVWIWLLQAALFWISHIYYLGNVPFSFWVLVPAAGLLFGLVAWRSRSIAASMLAHGFTNGVGQIVAVYRF
jgi:membrane protease YdiL (CAAX protease family)